MSLEHFVRSEREPNAIALRCRRRAALSVEAGAGLPRSTLVSRLRSAEVRIGAHTDVVDPRLGQAAREMRAAIAGLRRAIATEADTGTATDVVLGRIDDLDVACQARLRPDSVASPS